MTNQTTLFHQWFKQHRPAHTPKRGEQSQTNQTKNHWHTIEFSHNTRTPKHTPQPGPVQSGLSDPTHTHTTNKIAVNADSSERIYQRSFSYRHLTKTRLNQTVWRGVVGHADSHKATHTQPTTQIARSGGKNRR